MSPKYSALNWTVGRTTNQETPAQSASIPGRRVGLASPMPMLFAVLEKRGPRQRSDRFINLKMALCPRTPSVNDTLGNALMVEMGDLLAQNTIFQQ